MKRLSKALAILIAVSLFLTACGGNNQAPDNNAGDKNDGGAATTPAEEPEELTLRVSWWGGDERHQKTLQAIELFEEKNPGITIEPEYGGWDGHLEKVTTQVAGGTAPDVMQFNWNWLYTFSKDGTGFYDLNQVSDTINLNNYDQVLLDQVTINGKVNALPVGIGGLAFYFNKSTYDKAGVAIPKTFDDLFAAAPVFKEKLGQDYYPMVLDNRRSWSMVIYYLEQKYGKGFIDLETNQVAYTKDQLVEGMNFFLKMQDTGVIPSLDTVYAAGNVPVEQMPAWIQGRYGAAMEWDSGADKYQNSLEGDQELVTGDYITGAGDNKSALTKITMAFVINRDTKYPQAAAKFLNFMMSDPEAVKILGLTRGIVSNKAALEVLEAEGLLKGPNYEGNVKAQEFMGQPISPYFEDSQLQSLYELTMQQVSYKQTSPEDAADKLINEVNSMLKTLSFNRRRIL